MTIDNASPSQPAPQAVDAEQSPQYDFPDLVHNATSMSSPEPKTPAAAAKPPSLRRYLVLAVLLIFVIAIACMALDVLRKNGVTLSLAPVSTEKPSDALTQLVEVQQGVALLYSASAGDSYIFVRLRDQPNLLLISGNDPAVSQPSLSPDGQSVAYISRQGAGELKIVSVLSGTQQTISVTVFAASAQPYNVENLDFCNWDRPRWSPKGDRIAFWACDAKQSFSIALVIDFAVNPPSVEIVRASEADSKSQRQLGWLDAQHLIITIPESDSSRLPAYKVLNSP